MSGIEIQEFVDGAKRATVFAFLRDLGNSMDVVCRSDPKEKAESIALRFWKRAQSYSGTGARFVVAAYGVDNKVLDTLPLVIDGDELENIRPHAPAPLTVDFALRHSLKAVEARDLSNRKMQADLHDALHKLIGTLSRDNEKLRKHNDELVAHRIVTIKAVESLKTEAHTRALNQIEAKENAKAQSFIFEQVVENIPVIIGALTGATKASKFVESLDQKKLDILKAHLTDEQKANFGELLRLGDRADNARKRLESATAKAAKETATP